MELPRIARKPVEVTVAATLPSGAAAHPGGIEFALCDHGGPTAVSIWATGQYDPATDIASVVLCGREATDKSGALVLTVARAELWARPSGGAVIDAGYIDTIEGL